MTKSHILSVIIPCYRHASDCKQMMRRLQAVLKGRAAEIIVVVDGLKGDGEDRKAVDRLKKMSASNVRILSFDRRLGKGGAIAKGVKIAKGDYIAFIDADLVIDPRHLCHMQSYLERHPQVCGVVGKRSAYYTSSLRLILSYLFRLGHRLLFVRLPWDTQAGIKMLRAAYAKSAFGKLLIHGYAFDIEVLLRLLLQNNRIATHPVAQRMRGHSNVSIRTTVQMLRDTIQLYFWFLPQEIQACIKGKTSLVTTLLLVRHSILLPCALVLWLLLKAC